MTHGVLNSNPEEKWQPTRLDGDHMHMLELHIAGLTHREIAEHLGCTPQTVSNIVTSALGKQFISERIGGMDQEFMSLYGDVIGAVRDGLSPKQEPQVRLTAADKWLRAHGRYAHGDGQTASVTAEDVVRKLLERGAQFGTQVNVIKDSNVVFAGLRPAQSYHTSDPLDPSDNLSSTRESELLPNE